MENFKANEWSRTRFGGTAEALRAVIPHAIASADELAYRGHVASEAVNGYGYGMNFWSKSNERLLDYVADIEGVQVRRLPGIRRVHQSAIVEETGVALIPVRLQESGSKGRVVRLRREPSASMAVLLGPEAVPDRLATLNDEFFGLEDPSEREAQLEFDHLLTGLGTVVTIGIETDSHGGVSSLVWGDLALVEGTTRDAVWKHVEVLEFPRRGQGFLGEGAVPIAVGEARGFGARLNRFDSEGDDDGPALTLRANPKTP